MVNKLNSQTPPETIMGKPKPASLADAPVTRELVSPLDVSAITVNGKNYNPYVDNKRKYGSGK